MTAIADAHTGVAIDLPGHGRSPGQGFRGVGDYTYFVVEQAGHWMFWEQPEAFTRTVHSFLDSLPGGR